MARTVIGYTGWETGVITTAAGSDGWGTSVSGSGTATIETTNKRNGNYSVKLATAGSAGTSFLGNNTANEWTSVLGENFWMRIYFKSSDNPGSIINILRVWKSNAVLGSIRLNTDGTLGLYDSTGTLRGSNSTATVTDGNWHRIELFYSLQPGIPSGQNQIIGGHLDGVQWTGSKATSGATSDLSVRMEAGYIDSPGNNKTAYIDDICVVKGVGYGVGLDTGASKILNLVPNALGNANAWDTLNPSSPTNRWDNIDDIPVTTTGYIQETTTTAKKEQFNLTSKLVGCHF